MRAPNQSASAVKPKPTIGWREWVALPDLAVDWVKAKVDTGARSSTLHAWDIEIDEGAGRVRFTVHPLQDDDAIIVAASAPLLEQREVRSSNGEVEIRPVISTVALVGGSSHAIELTLSNRDEMGFRMLLGRSAIRRRFLVDPGRSFLGGGDRVTAPS